MKAARSRGADGNLVRDCGARSRTTEHSRLPMQSMLCVLILAVVATGTVFGQGVDARSLRRKQADQQQARRLTRDLIAGVLDVQLRQLDDNGLQDMPVYRDIQAMRENINALVDREMAEVVALLATAQTGGPAEREAAFVQARRAIRGIVNQLTAERRNLLRRLKIAEIVEQVTRLIALESQALKTTQSLPGRPQDAREMAAIQTIEDQRDIKHLFVHFVESLSEIRDWDGPVGQAAVDGLQSLKKDDVGRHLDDAGTTLEAADYAAAATHQAAVITALRKLLQQFQELQGPGGPNPSDALEKLDELARRQTEVREQTQADDSSNPADDDLVGRQSQIHDGLGELLKSLTELPDASAHVEQAQTAAYEATADLFEGKREQALANQDRVLEQLSAMKEKLAQMADVGDREKTAQEPADATRDVARAAQSREQNQQQEQPTGETAENQAAKALNGEMAVSDAPDDGNDGGDDSGDDANVVNAYAAKADEPADPQAAEASEAAERSGFARLPKAGSGEVDSPSSVEVHEPWFAKLPPEVRAAIRASARQRTPRAYEERLKRYFESIAD
jgi:hypothetical protein